MLWTPTHDIGQMLEQVPRALTVLRRYWLRRTGHTYVQTWEAMDVYMVIADVLRLQRSYTSGGTAWTNLGIRPEPDEWRAWRHVDYCSVSVWPVESGGLVLMVEDGPRHHPADMDEAARLTWRHDSDTVYVWNLSELVVQQFQAIHDALNSKAWVGESWSMAMGRAGYEWDHPAALENRDRVLAFIKRVLKHHGLWQGWP